MRRRSRLFPLLVVAVLLVPATPAAGSSDAHAGAPPAVGSPPLADLSAPANTTIEVRLYDNASARWSVTVAYVVESPAERDSFARYLDEYRSGGTAAGPTADTFRALAARAAATTDRRMRIANVTRSGSVDDGVGRVTLSFVWHGLLARADAGTLRLDDALLVDDGDTWLSSLEADQRLVIRTPPGYSIVDSSGPAFDIRDNAVVIEGPRTFDRPLTVTYRRSAPPDRPTGPGVPWGLVGGVALGVALAVAVAVRYRRRPDAPPATSDGGDAVADEPATDPDGAGGTGAGTDADAGADGGAGSRTGVDPDLLSDEERVERLLAANGGRMKQTNIVDETGWSDAKVSQLLSEMAEEGRVDKLRLGRENLISLPDEGAADDAGDAGDDRDGPAP